MRTMFETKETANSGDPPNSSDPPFHASKGIHSTRVFNEPSPLQSACCKKSLVSRTPSIKSSASLGARIVGSPTDMTAQKKNQYHFVSHGSSVPLNSPTACPYTLKAGPR
jgi:hypothetical protein